MELVSLWVWPAFGVAACGCGCLADVIEKSVEGAPASSQPEPASASNNNSHGERESGAPAARRTSQGKSRSQSPGASVPKSHSLLLRAPCWPFGSPRVVCCKPSFFFLSVSFWQPNPVDASAALPLLCSQHVPLAFRALAPFTHLFALFAISALLAPSFLRVACKLPRQQRHACPGSFFLAEKGVSLNKKRKTRRQQLKHQHHHITSPPSPPPSPLAPIAYIYPSSSSSSFTLSPCLTHVSTRDLLSAIYLFFFYFFALGLIDTLFVSCITRPFLLCSPPASLVCPAAYSLQAVHLHSPTHCSLFFFFFFFSSPYPLLFNFSPRRPSCVSAAFLGQHTYFFLTPS